MVDHFLYVATAYPGSGTSMRCHFSQFPFLKGVHLRPFSAVVSYIRVPLFRTTACWLIRYHFKLLPLGNSRHPLCTCNQRIGNGRGQRFLVYRSHT